MTTQTTVKELVRDPLTATPTVNGALVSAQQTTPTTPRPSNLAGALLKAQEQCQPVPLDALNARGKPYPTPDVIYDAAHEALKGCGLVTFPLGHAPAAQSDVNTQGKEWLLLVCKWELQHVDSGEVKVFQGCWPVLFERGRSVEDAFKITLTRAMSGFLWELLRMRRGRPTAAALAEMAKKQPGASKPAPAQQPTQTKPETKPAVTPTAPPQSSALPFGEMLDEKDVKAIWEAIPEAERQSYFQGIMQAFGVAGLRPIGKRWQRLLTKLVEQKADPKWFREKLCDGKRFCDLDEPKRISVCTAVMEGSLRPLA